MKRAVFTNANIGAPPLLTCWGQGKFMNRLEDNGHTQSVSDVERLNNTLKSITQPARQELIDRLDGEYALAITYKRQRKKLIGLMKAMFGAKSTNRQKQTDAEIGGDAQAILTLAKKGNITTQRVAEVLNCDNKTAGVKCGALCRRGELKKVDQGVYALP